MEPIYRRESGAGLLQLVADRRQLASRPLVLTTDGAWYATGRNLNGQMSTETLNGSANKWTQIQVPAGNTVKKRVFGNDSGVLLATDGSV